MKKLSVSIFAILATASLACSSSKSTPGTGGTDGSVVGELMPDPNGFMNGTVDGVLGAWYSYGDSYNAANPNNLGDCQTAGFDVSDCSVATSPVFGSPFTNTDGNMCMSGTAAVVMDSNYSAIWGLGIGFDFNNAGVGDAGASATSAKLPWNATMYGVTGFKFTVTGVPTGGNMRAEFPFMGQTGTDAPYWMGAANNLSPITADGTYSFKWTDVTGPMYETTPPKFDPTMIISAQFHVVTNTKGTIAVSNPPLCISHVILTTD